MKIVVAAAVAHCERSSTLKRTLFLLCYVSQRDYYYLIVVDERNHEVKKDTDEVTMSSKTILYISLGIAGGMILIVAIVITVWCRVKGYECGKGKVGCTIQSFHVLHM